MSASSNSIHSCSWLNLRENFASENHLSAPSRKFSFAFCLQNLSSTSSTEFSTYQLGDRYHSVMRCGPWWVVYLLNNCTGVNKGQDFWEAQQIKISAGWPKRQILFFPCNSKDGIAFFKFGKRQRNVEKADRAVWTASRRWERQCDEGCWEYLGKTLEKWHEDKKFW